jgi:hypothetical protein
MLRSGLTVNSIGQALIAGLAIIVVGGVAYGAFSLGLYRPSISEHGQVTAAGESGRNRITAETRRILIGSRRFWQVEVSPGVWRDCGRDCAEVLRKAMSP